MNRLKNLFTRYAKTAALVLTAMLGAAALTGCGSVSQMRLVEPETVSATQAPTLTADKSYVVFFRPRMLSGAAITPVLVDATDGENPQLIGMMANGTKLIYQTTPGKHQYFFTATSIVGPLLTPLFKAELMGGKIYYVRVMGGEALMPITNVKNEQFLKDYATSRWIENTPESHSWFDARKETYLTRFEQAYQMPTDELKNIQGYDGPVSFEVLPSYGVTEILWAPGH